MTSTYSTQSWDVWFHAANLRVAAVSFCVSATAPVATSRTHLSFYVMVSATGGGLSSTPVMSREQWLTQYVLDIPTGFNMKVFVVFRGPRQIL